MCSCWSSIQPCQVVVFLFLNKLYGCRTLETNSFLLQFNFQFLVLILEQGWSVEQTSSRSALCWSVINCFLDSCSIVKVLAITQNSNEQLLSLLPGCWLGSNKYTMKAWKAQFSNGSPVYSSSKYIKLTLREYGEIILYLKWIPSFPQ